MRNDSEGTVRSTEAEIDAVKGGDGDVSLMRMGLGGEMARVALLLHI